MENTPLEQLLEDENQKLVYVFDMMAERVFFIELTEIITRKNLDKAQCVLSEGDAPVQIMVEDFSAVSPKTVLDENFYGDEDFEMDELEEEGFGEMNFDDSSLFNDDPKF